MGGNAETFAGGKRDGWKGIHQEKKFLGSSPYEETQGEEQRRG